ncbi:unnamed protein product [Calicophoron daubneyi]|uniref:ADP-ribosylation factor n=1 Tax=Calicophoron daubneyi TaxID=300641 RepID=A0AAV2TXQ2_CALDB
MGQILSFFMKLFPIRKEKQQKILLLGLDGAGKTTLLYWARLRTAIVTIPTVGMNVEELKLSKIGITFLAWDIGGQEKLRKMWSRFFEDAKGLIFVVDSADLGRLDAAKSELQNVLNESSLDGIPFIVLANKQDLQGAITAEDLERRFSLPEFQQNGSHKGIVKPTVATTGSGVMEALESFGVLVKQYVKDGKRR